MAKITCVTCDGTGIDYFGKTCKTCKGTGKHLSSADRHSTGFYGCVSKLVTFVVIGIFIYFIIKSFFTN